MDDRKLHQLCWNNAKSLDPDKLEIAVEILRAEFPPETMTDLKSRIEEDRYGWLGGRKDTDCFFCKGTGQHAKLNDEGGRLLDEYEQKHCRPKPGILTLDKAWEEKREALANDLRYGELETCPVCKGTKRHHEMGLHHGFGTAVRNILRKKGCGEDFFGIENLDDYYMPMLELAAGFQEPA